MTHVNYYKLKYGFTLIELLVVIAILSILISITIVIAGQVIKSAKSQKEAGALRLVLQAYTLAAIDRKGKLIIGYGVSDEPVMGFDGETIPPNSPDSWRYVFRLLPYLDDAISTLYVNEQNSYLDYLPLNEEGTYSATLCPSFGLNSMWLGGDNATTGMDGLVPSFTSFLSGVRHPSNQLVFASAKASVGYLGTTGTQPLEGWFRVESPYWYSWHWHAAEGSFIPTEDSLDHGYLSTRHQSKVLTGQLDGSTNFQTIEELLDMRKWNPKANSSDWTDSLP
jgi:prepilin-type N-terminal cleavage/methylation domain-containing protein